MSIVVAEPFLESDARLSDAAFTLKRRRLAELPWWAIELLDLTPHTPEHRVRRMLRYSPPRFALIWNTLAALVERAEATVMRKSIEQWRELAYNDQNGPIARLVRDAALFNPRAFVALCDLRDEEANPIVLEDFHLQMLRAMRCATRPAMIQAFWGGGKSWNSSTIVPLMDWAEWPTATQGRIYLDEGTIKKWTGRLMQIVEENDSLHKLFPWVSKPVHSDPRSKIWGFEGFCIAGNPVRQRSFEGHTIGSQPTGFRFMRIGIDDVVSDKEAATASIQDRNLNFIKRVALTARQIVKRPVSKYGTVFPSIYTVGTPYDRGDVNVRLEDEYRQKQYKVVRVPIFIDDNPMRPRWAARDTPQTIEYMKEEMGLRAFNMRCRLKVGGLEHSMFPESEVDWALKDGRSDLERFAYCVVPPNTKLIIGFDPASGRRPQHHGARYPAYAVYGVRDQTAWQPRHPSVAMRDFDPSISNTPPQPDLYHHVVQWGRLEGMGFHTQCQKMVELARAYNCPVAFEDNTLQMQYGEEMGRIASDVRVISHTTGLNKRDPVQGVEQFEPILHNKRLIIHAEGAPPDQVKALREELVGWPTHAFSDLVMALWIARYQYALHVQASQPAPVSRRPVPAYMQRFATPWYRR